ncbi:DnaJ domain-containing protein, putative [Eimeria mitis]|uniref:DnaJ domain-containing protein, putative n=1 Tax=Eimeria mitis TaxID=44415 RepID=U6JWZ0_9EIME|nr:DnaJ domain-containing protein, putative [Eimeria mitis]CDJ29985.1 DnaJ domain-containing protein, putative [Eimeria mitis]
MTAHQRKRKTGGGAGESTYHQRQQHQHHQQHEQQATASDSVSGAEEPMSPRKTHSNIGKNARKNEKGQNMKSVFSKAATLDMSDAEDAQTWSGSGAPLLNAAVEQDRVRKEKEKKKAKREQQDRNRSNRDSHGKQKKATKGSPFSRLLHFFTGGDFRSWLMYSLVIVGIVGIFVLKALEEYYGMDGDVSGEQRLQHLSVLGLEDGASESDIRRSYRTLSVRWHPDRYPNCGASCQQRFHEIAAAYEYLMRKQKKSNVDDEDGGGEGSQGEEFTNLKITSQGIVDFSSLGPNDVFPPTADTKNVWSIMVHQDKDDWSQSVYEMWQESSRALGKYVKFGVITIRGRSGKDALKKLPINVKIFPAILLLTAGMHPEQYPSLSRPSVDSLNRFIADAFPTTLDIVESARELKSWLASSSSSQPLAAQYKVVIVPSAASASKPSLLVKHAAFSNKHLFNFCFVSNTRSVLTKEKEELLAVLKNPPTWVPQLSADSATAKALRLPLHSEELRENDFATNSNALLFVDEGRGVSRMQATLQTARSKLLNPSTALSLALERFKANVEPFLYQQNSSSLCKGSLQRRVFCLVAVEPEEGKTDAQTKKTHKTLDLARIRQLLQASKQKYLADNPRKNLEAVWERAVQKARDHDKSNPQRGDSESGDSTFSTKEPDDLHIEQPDDIEEEIIHVQLVRVSVGRPFAVPSLPGLPKDSQFKRLMNEELEDAPIFLLDLEGSRVAPVPALYVGEAGASGEGAEALYSRIYQILDELQNATDEDEDAKISFSELPEYCAGQEFAKRCLASEQKPWWSFFQAGSLWIQLGLLAAVGGLVFFAWNKITAEKFLCGMLLFSLAIGAWSSIQPILSSMFGFK